ncbi:hypothetical protein MUY27_09470 [Mucilaginibacter sp. RS28]|uniref:Uncharacterized protein n=1 Tax=Mucilaginibacter straminoryzae TaxID=2932774 RepID=A0A9X1X318_9SPHI|nr:hypothetical protein [Mucilaginibacter straminoryzae]MCJ8209936.1 hypothetical protein [Mucilaginibacter straminoryzae]
MPLNELEKHPYLDYHQTLPLTLQRPKSEFTGLIIGTFPIYDITMSHDGQTHRFGNGARMQFFYGSSENSFWETLTTILRVDDDDNPLKTPNAKDGTLRAINLLTSRGLLITDVIKCTNRYNNTTKNGKCPLDQSLLNCKGAPLETLKGFQYNNGIKDILSQYPGIKNLFFTNTGVSGITPFGLFQKEIFKNKIQIVNEYKAGTRLFAQTIRIDNKMYDAFFLPSPAGEGFRGLSWGDKRPLKVLQDYVRSKNPKLYNELVKLKQSQRSIRQSNDLTNLRKSFFEDCWRAAIVDRNKGFFSSLQPKL